MDFTLEQLKEIAKKLNFPHSPNIGVDKLKDKLVAYAEELGTSLEEVYKDVEASKPVEETFSTDNATVIIPKKFDLDPEIERLKTLTFSGVEATQTKIDESKQLREAMRLIRCTISCNNKNKSALTGEIFTARNAVLPEVKKFIPFGVVTHIPKILFNVIKEKQYQMFNTKKVNGVPIKESSLTNEYNIQELPPITREEFEAIQKKQLAEGYTGV